MEPIEKAGDISVNGCSSFTFFNSGNTNVTINRSLILMPGESWPNFDPHPDIEVQDKFTIEFNIGADIAPPTFEAPAPGINAADGSGTNPGGKFDTRLILIKGFLS